MKTWKGCLFVIMLILLASGCAELRRYEVSRSVDDNLLSSSFPELKVQIDKNLSYIGTIEGPAQEQSRTMKTDVQYSTASYLFGRFTPEGMLDRGVLVRFRVLTGDPGKAPQEQDGQGAENPIETGSVRVYEEEYRYQLYTGKSVLAERELGLLKPSAATPCYLIKRLEKDAGLGNKSGTRIYYFENIASVCPGTACEDCLGSGIADERRQQVLRDFDERSYRSIAFLETRKVIDATSKYGIEKGTPPAGLLPSTPLDKEPSADTVEHRLRTLKDLLDKNLITQEDYDRKKEEILKGL
ncbi:MAG TPA: SHOCT domain-containing protein [Deltaproteobacteria bacterium]|nr:SHOCT domain-containing protein [Deltaproteobacteria bacterium]